MSESRDRPGCFRCGCFGCLGLVIVGVLVLVLLTFVQFRRESRDAVVEDARLERTLPTRAEFDELRRLGELGASSGTAASSRLVDGPLAAGVGRIELDLDLGDFEIRAGEPGSDVQVEGTYEPDAFRLEESFEQSDDGSWLYRVEFGPRGGMAGVLFRGAGSRPENRLTITLPPDVPFDLNGNWGIGEVRADLGGLWLRSVNLDMATGSHELSFSKPTLWPVSELTIDKGPGELLVDLLGNASPARTDVDQSIGSVRVDLGGAWLADGEVKVDTRIGEVDIDAPSTARLVIGDASTSLGESYIDPAAREVQVPEGAPTVTLQADLSLGEIRVDGPRERAPRDEERSRREGSSGPM